MYGAAAASRKDEKYMYGEKEEEQNKEVEEVERHCSGETYKKCSLFYRKPSKLSYVYSVPQTSYQS